MRLVAGRDLQGGCLHLDEGALLEPSTQGGADAAARFQERAAGGVDVGPPPGGGRKGHGATSFGGLAKLPLIV